MFVDLFDGIPPMGMVIMSIQLLRSSFRPIPLLTFQTLSCLSFIKQVTCGSSNREIAVITGGTRGIGYGIAQKFAQSGVRCVILGRSKETIEESRVNLMNKQNDNDIVDKIRNDEEKGVLEHLGFVCNVGNPEDVEKVCEDIAKLGNINYLINAAGTMSYAVGLGISSNKTNNALGITCDGLAVKLRKQDILDTIQTNLLGTIYMCSKIAKHMIKQKQGGCIINISSVVGIHGNVGQSIYAASKAGIIGFSKSLAKELGSRNIRVNVIAPGYIETDMTAGIPDDKRKEIRSNTTLNRFGKPEDVAIAALYLAKARFVTGQTLIVDGGLNI
ncbi:10539_t:CDS:2 [Acaulospora morrowiae]|uniref:10539_t:CDS:1 n=1 Tax=Acaulospora morrowiae TaxID=94023 RepID=A0A9N8VLU9_9GLOM|nr:10539_t:CDS:2 [Acaulospora morrowiae]